MQVSQIATRSVVGDSHAEDGTGNQDSFFIERTDSHFFAGVFDGHGAQGDKAATLACRTTRDKLIDGLAQDNIMSLRSLVQDALKEAARVVRGAECAASSGTTATLVGVRGDDMVVGHVGDSCAALLARDWRKVAPRFVTKPHRPGVSASEDTRVIKYGGVLYEGYVVSSNDTFCFLHRSVPCLATLVLTIYPTG